MQIRVLSDETQDNIHEATLKVLEEIGVWFLECPEAHELLAENGCKVDGDNVRLPRGLMADALASVPDRNELPPFMGLGSAEPLGLKQGEVHFGLIGNAYTVYDYDAGQSREIGKAKRLVGDGPALISKANGCKNRAVIRRLIAERAAGRRNHDARGPRGGHTL